MFFHVDVNISGVPAVYWGTAVVSYLLLLPCWGPAVVGLVLFSEFFRIRSTKSTLNQAKGSQ